MNQPSPYANPYAAPQAPQTGFGAPPGGYAPAGATDVHVEGTKLVAANGIQLPPMCMKCGAAPTHWRAQRYQYTPPWAFLVLGWIGVLAFSKRATFQIPLCETHRAEWKKWTLIAGLSWIPGLVLIAVAAAIGDDTVEPILVLVAVVLLLGALIAALAMRGRRGVYPSKINATHSWLQGVHASVLQAVSTGQMPAPAGYAAPGYAPQGPYGAPPPGYGPPPPGYGYPR